MGLKIKVKAGNINNLSDARYCSGMGVEMLGFKIDPGFDDSVSPELFNAITGWVSGPLIVGEIESSNLPDPGLFEVGCLQVSDVDLLAEIKSRGLKTILKIDISAFDTYKLEKLMKDNSDDVNYFLITAKEGSDLTPDDMDNISKWSKKYSIMLGFGVTKDNLNSILGLGIDAISIYGSSEIRPGYKSYDEMADILEKLED